mgnify:CR=1 FL=1|tara:strand:+ start:42 stop:248 length:207 start_codon:yes stop_codon:yes gene_type:complete
MKTKTTYLIGRPINDIVLNGNEWLLGDDNKPRHFNTYDEAFEFVSSQIDEVTPDEYIYNSKDYEPYVK